MSVLYADQKQHVSYLACRYSYRNHIYSSPPSLCLYTSHATLSACGVPLSTYMTGTAIMYYDKKVYSITLLINYRIYVHAHCIGESHCV